MLTGSIRGAKTKTETGAENRKETLLMSYIIADKVLLQVLWSLKFSKPFCGSMQYAVPYMLHERF